jgi:hypothetical protein
MVVGIVEAWISIEFFADSGRCVILSLDFRDAPTEILSLLNPNLCLFVINRCIAILSTT